MAFSSKPDRFVFYENIDLNLAIGGGVDEEVGLVGWEVGFFHLHCPFGCFSGGCGIWIVNVLIARFFRRF